MHKGKCLQVSSPNSGEQKWALQDRQRKAMVSTNGPYKRHRKAMVSGEQKWALQERQRKVIVSTNRPYKRHKKAMVSGEQKWALQETQRKALVWNRDPTRNIVKVHIAQEEPNNLWNSMVMKKELWKSHNRNPWWTRDPEGDHPFEWNL
jgi:hypothetical protein